MYIQSKQKLTNSFPLWEKIRIWIFLALFTGLSLIYGTMLIVLFNILAPEKQSGVDLVRSGILIWFIVGIILSLGTVGWFMNRIHLAYLKKKHGSIASTNHYKTNPEGRSFTKIFTWISLSIALIFSLLIYDSYLIIDKERITINEFLSFGERKYRTDEIASLTCKRLVGEKGLPIDLDYIVRFKDGSQFNSRNNILDLSGIFKTLAERSDIAIDTLTSNSH
jgi:hypothetical protein